MNDFDLQLNDLLSDTFRAILKFEEKTIKQSSVADVSISELHLIESIARQPDQTLTIGDIAIDLGITKPSVTNAIQKLEQKGLVERIKDGSDGRRVFVSLTKVGKKVNSVHGYFHEHMVKNISALFTEEEKSILLKGVRQLNKYFVHKNAEDE